MKAANEALNLTRNSAVKLSLFFFGFSLYFFHGQSPVSGRLAFSLGAGEKNNAHT